jgi:hypothetical protein
MAPSFTPPLVRRAVFSVGPLAIALGILVGACGPDPAADYEDFQKATDGVRGVKVGGAGAGGESGAGGEAGESGAGGEGGSAAAGIPDATGTFHVSCLSSLALEDTENSIRFIGDIKVENITETGATVTMSLAPLTVGATSTSAVVGTPLTGTAEVSADKTFTLSFGATVTVPGTANPISGSNIVIENGSMAGILKGADAFCAELNGHVTAPVDYSLDPPSVDVCVFQRVVGDTVAPILDNALYVCQLPTHRPRPPFAVDVGVGSVVVRTSPPRET